MKSLVKFDQALSFKFSQRLRNSPWANEGPQPWFGVSRMKRMDGSFQCCIKDEGRPLLYALQKGYINYFMVL